MKNRFIIAFQHHFLFSLAMVRFIICLFVTIIPVRAKAQDATDLVKILDIRQQVDSLECRINKLVRRIPQLKHTVGIRMYHVFELLEDKYGAVEHLFDDIRNIKDLSCRYAVYKPKLFFKKKKRYLKTNTWVCDSMGNVLALGDWHKLYFIEPHLRQKTYKDGSILAHDFITHKLNGAFRLLLKTSDGLFIYNDIFCIDHDGYYSIQFKGPRGFEKTRICKKNKDVFISKVQISDRTERNCDSIYWQNIAGVINEYSDTLQIKSQYESNIIPFPYKATEYNVYGKQLLIVFSSWGSRIVRTTIDVYIRQDETWRILAAGTVLDCGSPISVSLDESHYKLLFLSNDIIIGKLELNNL